MTTENYISKYYLWSKCKVKSAELKVLVLKSIYDQYFSLFNQQVTSRKKEYVTKKLCSLFFYLRFITFLKDISQDENQDPDKNKNLDNPSLNDICTAISCKNLNQLLSYIKILINLNLIQVSNNLNSYMKDDQLFYIQRNNSYTIFEKEYNLNLNSNSYIQLSYTVSKDLSKVIKSKVRSLSYNNSIPPISISPYKGVIYSLLTNYQSNSNASKNEFRSNADFLKYFLQIYRKLYAVDLVGNIDFQITKELRNSSASLHTDNRIYHKFHGVSKDIRNTRIFLNGDHLVEIFDISNSQHVLLNCLLDNTIPVSEKESWYRLTTSGKFYEAIRDFVNCCECANWSREDAKLYSNKYYNIRNKTLKNAGCAKKTNYRSELCVDLFFEENYPNIRKFIYENKENLHDKLNKVETEIMVFGICKYLKENYCIDAISLHDGIFMRECDANYLKENNITIKSLFLNFLNLYEYI